jgi:ubiquitin conjugation factor E4 B
MSIWGYGRERNGILGNLLNTNPMALKHLMPALMHFYIGMVLLSCKYYLTLYALCAEVEQTGASSQFYDKFSRCRFMMLTSSVIQIFLDARSIQLFVYHPVLTL